MGPISSLFVCLKADVLSVQFSPVGLVLCGVGTEVAINKFKLH